MVERSLKIRSCLKSSFVVAFILFGFCLNFSRYGNGITLQIFKLERKHFIYPKKDPQCHCDRIFAFTKAQINPNNRSHYKDSFSNSTLFELISIKQPKDSLSPRNVSFLTNWPLQPSYT